MILLLDIVLVVFSILMLWKGADWLVEAAAEIAHSLKISDLVIGLTVVAFGTSAPEFAVTLKAALTGQTDISIGNVVGSNIFNIIGVLGFSVWISGEINISTEFKGINSIILLAASFWVLYIAVKKPNNTKLFGFISILSYAFYTIFIYL